MRRATAFLLSRWVLHPATVGAAYMLALVALAARRGAAAEQALGGQSRAINAAVHTHFSVDVHRITIAIVGVTIAIGSVLGAASGLIVDLRDRFAGVPRRSVWGRALASLVVTAVAQAFIEAYAIATNPQLFVDAFYAQGGAARTLEVVVTDVLGPRVVVLFGVVALLLTLAGPVSRWNEWPGRARGWIARPGVGRTTPVVVGALSMVTFVVLSAALLDVSPAAAAGPPSAKPNILILAADSLRADRINARVAPHLAALGERGARFDRAYVSLPRTFPSWVTLLTGRHPHHHGIRSMFPRWDERAKDFDALPGRLARDGYFTAVVSDFAGDIFDRIGLGWTTTRVPTFDFKELIRQRALERQTPLLPYLHSRAGRAIFPVLREMNDAADPELLTRDAIDTIASAGDKPFFVTVFFSTAHFPYAAPAPYYGKFTSRPYRGRYKYDKPVGLEHELPPDAADIAQVRGLYDGAVSGVDAGMGAILDALARSGHDKNTIVVLVADHGETLFENGHGEGHGDHLFGDEGTHVPLIVLDPRHPAHRRISSVVRDVDLAPTLYDLTGTEAPTDLDGESLAAALDGRELAPRLAFAETGLWFTEDIAGLDPSLRMPYPGIAGLNEVDADHGDEVVLRREMQPLTLVAKHRMVRDERYKLIYAPTRHGAQYLLFDTENDPGETRDISSELPLQASRLKGELWRWMLSDHRMVEKHGVLVPRDDGALAPSEPSAHVIRVDAVPTSSASSPGAEP